MIGYRYRVDVVIEHPTDETKLPTMKGMYVIANNAKNAAYSALNLLVNPEDKLHSMHVGRAVAITDILKEEIESENE